ncbi:MAG: 2-phosphosulfolactate phosphatase [Bernardetiaceae bacterium]|nr:2-phosphosulfolactate phosphatase [Bernardetiaceae bacterium]
MNRFIEVCISPSLLSESHNNFQCTVVTDIFRATSSMVASMGNGANWIIPVSSPEQALSYRTADSSLVIAGEQGGDNLAGFDLGNSPLEHAMQGGKSIVMSTTNGTKAIRAIQNLGTGEILIGAFLNLSKTADYITSKEGNLLILCAGWKGNFSLEDTLYAGALIEKLLQKNKLFSIEKCDSALAALTLYRQVSSNLADYLRSASHYKRLIRKKHKSVEQDLAYSLQIDKFNIVLACQGDKIQILNF